MIQNEKGEIIDKDICIDFWHYFAKLYGNKSENNNETLLFKENM